jgi:hypothetical protein
MTDKIADTKTSLTFGQLVTWLSWVAMIILVIIALSNWESLIHLRLFDYRFSVSFGFILIVSLVAGSFAGISDYMALNRGARGNQIQERWQAQDVKLAASLTSDREKQLEAKISTLEAALEKALKKSG